MQASRIILKAGACLSALVLTTFLPNGILRAQDFPARPIRIVITEPPGGGVDRTARLVADKLREKWGQPGVVETHAGAGGNIAAELVARAPADGYTLLFTPPGPLVVNKSLYAKLGFDPDALMPVSQLTSTPSVLVARPGVADSLKALIALAKANPDKLNYASSGSGTTQHLSAELLKSMADIRLAHVPYKGQAPALLALVSGQVDVMFANLGTTLPQVKAGKLRALAVGSEKRNALLPDVPAIAETLPGFVATTWAGMVAPPGTPPAIVEKLSAALAEAMRQPDIQKQLAESFTDAVGSTPSEFAILLRQERDRWGKVVRATGARAD